MDEDSAAVRLDCLFITRRSSDPGDAPELISAWDEYSQDSNPVGADEDRAQALESVDGDLLQWRLVRIHVPDHMISQQFRGQDLVGRVEE